MKSVDAYIAQFDPEIQSRLKELTQLFHSMHPNIEESIKYNMPAYKMGKQYLYFAAYKRHIGFYPVNNLLEIEDELARYRAKGTKDTLHFLHNKAMPYDLIKKIISLKSLL